MASNASTRVSKEAAVVAAMSAVEEGRYRSVRAAAEAFGVNRMTLSRRLAGTPSKAVDRSARRALNAVEEEVLLQRLLELDTRGFPATLAVVEDMANTLLKQRGGKPVGKNWSQRFVNKQPLLRTRFSRSLDHLRGRAEHPSKVKSWFERLEYVIRDKGVVLEDVYNFDETGFRLGALENAIVVTSNSAKTRPKTLSSNNRESTTVIVAINSQGWSIPPFVIFKAKTFDSSWFDNLGAGWALAVSDNGWITSELALEWLKHFDKHTFHRRRGGRRLLIMDGHSTHLTDTFQSYCLEKEIVLVSLPAHSSHILQPLDVGCFGPFKRAYSDRLRALASLGYYNISKNDFLQEVEHAFERVFTYSNITASFRATGIVPFNSDEVLKRLRTPSPNEQQLQEQLTWNNHTPANPREVDLLNSALCNSYINGALSPISFARTLEYLSRSAHKQHAERALELRDSARKDELIQELQRRRTRKKTYRAVGAFTKQAFEVSVVAQNELDTQLQGDIDRSLQGAPLRTRAPKRCSNCRSLEHVFTVCPSRTLINNTSMEAITSSVDPQLTEL